MILANDLPICVVIFLRTEKYYSINKFKEKSKSACSTLSKTLAYLSSFTINLDLLTSSEKNNIPFINFLTFFIGTKTVPSS